MAIQTQFYTSSVNDMMLSPFCNNNGYCADHGLQQQLEQRLQQFYNESQRPIDPNVLVYHPKCSNHLPSSSSSHSFCVHNSQIEMQNEQIIDQQIDQYIMLQGENLRRMIQEQGKQQVVALLRKVESRSLSMLRKKDQEIAKAAKKRVELEEYLRRLELEKQAWQRMAQENEARTLSLYKTLEEINERGGYFGVVANDAESCCDESKEEEEENENENLEHIMRDEMIMVCKNCHLRKSSCLFLPCRHLSSCRDCDAFLKACPVCTMPKKASIETLIF